MKKLIFPAVAFSLFFSCQSKVPTAPDAAVTTATPVPAAIPRDYPGEAARFLREYSAQYQKLYTEASEAEWASNTRIVPGDDTNAKRTQAANEAMAAFTGSEENIKITRELLETRRESDATSGITT